MQEQRFTLSDSDFSTMTGGKAISAVVLAAGRGSRMGGPVSKVLIPLAGVPLVQRVVDTLKSSGVTDVVVVVSPFGEDVRDLLDGQVRFATQSIPKGSGDAAASGMEAISLWDSHSTIVACGDSPLFTSSTVRELIHHHLTAESTITLTSAELPDPTGYGRIVRDDSGRIFRIVEEKDAGSYEKRVLEVNGGLYMFNTSWLKKRLAGRATDLDDSTSEFVLTEVIVQAVAEGLSVHSIACSAYEVAGINTPEQLRLAELAFAEQGAE